MFLQTQFLLEGRVRDTSLLLYEKKRKRNNMSLLTPGSDEDHMNAGVQTLFAECKVLSNLIH